MDHEKTVTTTQHDDPPVEDEASTGAPSVDQAAPRDRRRRFSHEALVSYAVAAGCYVALALILWWNVWSSHPTSSTICGCGDSGLITWFIAWPAHAVTHAHSVLYSSAMGYPRGVNLVANASVLALGALFTPVTWLFGPVAAMNAWLTLAPVLSALAMFGLLRRWVSWTPAALVGGLFYGFSPFVVASLTNAWLMIALVAIPPLIVICLDELLLKQRYRAATIGVLLGLLLTLQFFISSEVLLSVMMGAAGVFLIVVYAAFTDRAALRMHFNHAAVGLASGGIISVVLLAYPAWFAVSGPAHFHGPVWGGGVYGSFRNSHATLANFFVPWSHSKEGFISGFWHQLGGYQGPVISNQYFGFGIAAVVVIGSIVWRRDRRLWLFGGLGLISVLFSLGSSTTVILPWAVFARLPIFYNVQPYRFVLVTYLAVAVMLGIILDSAYRSVLQRRQRPAADRVPARHRTWLAGLVAVVVAAVALLPPALDMASTIPLTIEPIYVPPWFRSVAPHLPGHQVVLAFPATFASPSSANAWQAESAMNISMVNQTGPAALLVRTTRSGLAADVLGNLSTFYGAEQPVTQADISAVRAALQQWRVTTVVIPNVPRAVPSYYRMPSNVVVAALMSAAIGKPPTYRADAWQWTGLNLPLATPVATTAQFVHCTAKKPSNGVVPVERASLCVLNRTGH